MKIQSVVSATSELRDLWAHALKDVRAKRGGVALLDDLCADGDTDAFFAHLIDNGFLWTVTIDDTLCAFGFAENNVVGGIYVAHGSRRQKIASTLVKQWLAGTNPPIDGYALPGDRAMKSLYESLGWKARLLTMRGA